MLSSSDVNLTSAIAFSGSNEYSILNVSPNNKLIEITKKIKLLHGQF